MSSRIAPQTPSSSAETDATIVVVCLDDNRLPEALETLIEAVAPGTVILPVPEMEMALAMPSRLPVLVLTESPEDSLAAGLNGAVDMAAVLAVWRQQAERQIAALTLKPRRTVAVARRALTETPQAVADLLVTRWKLAPASPGAVPAPSSRGSVLTLAAAEILRQSPQHEALAKKLRLAIKLAGDAREPPRRAISLVAEHALLLENLAQLQDHLSQQADLIQGQENELARMRQALSEGMAAHDSTTVRLERARREAAERRVAQQSGPKTQRVAILGTALLARARELEAQGATILGQQQELERFRTSLSWKITRPIRALRRSLTAR